MNDFFDYEPMNEEECEKAKQFELLEAGIYNFKVVEAIAKNSKSGNPMIQILIKITDQNGVEHGIYDYLVSTRQMMWKFKHFCDSIGLSKEYENKQFQTHLSLWKTGKASIGFQPGNKKDDGTYYRDKNIVEDYVMTDQGAVKVELGKHYSTYGAKPKEEFIDSDLPF